MLFNGTEKLIQVDIPFLNLKHRNIIKEANLAPFFNMILNPYTKGHFFLLILSVQ